MIHLPSLTQLDHATATRIWLCTGPTDKRRGFESELPSVAKELRALLSEVRGLPGVWES